MAFSFPIQTLGWRGVIFNPSLQAWLKSGFFVCQTLLGCGVDESAQTALNRG